MIIKRQVGHLTRLVDDLLDVSRITSGKVQLSLSRVEIADIVMRAIEMASPILEQRRHHLHLVVPRVGLAIRADSTRMAQVISNLLINASKYTDNEGTISITAKAEDETMVLRVIDSGMGIDNEMLPRVFDLFAQQSQTMDRAHGGLGLGLAIVRSLVVLHGGTVVAESEGRDKVRARGSHAGTNAQRDAHRCGDGLRTRERSQSFDGRWLRCPHGKADRSARARGCC
jgi:signal transduction histidine kinase